MPSSQKRPPGNPSGVRSNIGTVSNAGNQRVNNIANNVHGFQKTAGRGGGATAAAGGSRTVTVPPRRGGGGGGGGGGGRGGGADSAFGGQGRVLGGARSVPWYKRDPPAAAARAPSGSGAAASRSPTGIFFSPQADKSIPAGSMTEVESDIIDPATDAVTCPVCGEKVGLRGINDHVDHCLVAECERMEREAQSSQPSASAVWGEDSDDLMMSRAADALETSLETSVWEENTEDDRLLADAADELETSLEQGDGAAADRRDIYNGEGDCSGAASRSPASDASTVYELLDGRGEATALSPASEASTAYDEFVDGGRAAAAAAPSPSSDASTVYDEILNEPIVIDSSDEEDYCTQRANLSDVIRDFIRVEESDDELFDE